MQNSLQNEELKQKLLATGNEELVEGNNWGDTFWGMVNEVGENHLRQNTCKSPHSFAYNGAACNRPAENVTD